MEHGLIGQRRNVAEAGGVTVAEQGSPELCLVERVLAVVSRRPERRRVALPQLAGLGAGPTLHLHAVPLEADRVVGRGAELGGVDERRPDRAAVGAIGVERNHDVAVLELTRPAGEADVVHDHGVRETSPTHADAVTRPDVRRVANPAVAVHRGAFGTVVDLESGPLGRSDGGTGGRADHHAVAPHLNGQGLGGVPEGRDEVDVVEDRDVVTGGDVHDGALGGCRAQCRRGESRDRSRHRRLDPTSPGHPDLSFPAPR